MPRIARSYTRPTANDAEGAHLDVGSVSEAERILMRLRGALWRDVKGASAAGRSDFYRCSGAASSAPPKLISFAVGIAAVPCARRWSRSRARLARLRGRRSARQYVRRILGESCLCPKAPGRQGKPLPAFFQAVGVTVGDDDVAMVQPTEQADGGCVFG